MLAGMMARLRATSSRTNSGVMRAGIAAPPRVAAQALLTLRVRLGIRPSIRRRRFSQRENSISA